MKQKIAIWGTGKRAEKFLLSYGDIFDVQCFYDSTNFGFEKYGIIVKQYDPTDNIKIIIASTYWEEISDQLEKYGKKYLVDYIDSEAYEDGIQYDILQGDLYRYKGAIFENLVADIFAKMGRKLYYFRKASELEIDFVIRYKGFSTLIEVKANTGNAKSVKTVLASPDKYHVSKAIKLGNYNIDRSRQILILPLYMGFLLTGY